MTHNFLMPVYKEGGDRSSRKKMWKCFRCGCVKESVRFLQATKRSGHCRQTFGCTDCYPTALFEDSKPELNGRVLMYARYSPKPNEVPISALLQQHTQAREYIKRRKMKS
jgi:hypothetical protein